MELLFNVLWLLIAVFGLCVWRTHWVRQRRLSRRSSLREWTAFSCAVVLLFFTISMTDDLNSEILLYDDYSIGRLHSVARIRAQHPGHGGLIVPASGPALVLPGAALTPLRSTATITLAVHSSRSALRDKPFLGRAPPASSL